MSGNKWSRRKEQKRSFGDFLNFFTKTLHNSFSGKGLKSIYKDVKIAKKIQNCKENL